VEDVIEESLKHLDMHASEHHIECVHPEEMLFAEMDAKLIMQVIVNLVNNAVKYTPAGSRIVVSAEKQDDLVCISVADDGPGIPEEDREHIFELFWSGRHDVKDGYRSMGIGLNLCRMIMKAHGQKIEVSENEPHGTVFRFYLPLKGVESYERL
jgi:two-component system sensor histidine kinase KdpD